MWSRKFLWQGLTTGVLASALAISGMWLFHFVIWHSTDPRWTISYGLPSLILYPVCWYAGVYRPRNYSAARTMALVIVTFLAGWALVAVAMAVVKTCLAIMMVREFEPARLFPVRIWAPLMFAIQPLLGAVGAFVPFVVIAAPVTFLHRWLLLIVSNSAPRTIKQGAGVRA
jgi:hypothetical protein